MMNEFANHRLFDKKGRRLSIFGKIEGDNIKIMVFACSLQDKFSRKLARKVWELHLSGQPLILNELEFHPNIYKIAIEDTAHPKNCFLKHCNETYCKMYPIWDIVGFDYMTDAEADASLDMEIEPNAII